MRPYVDAVKVCLLPSHEKDMSKLRKHKKKHGHEKHHADTHGHPHEEHASMHDAHAERVRGRLTLDQTVFLKQKA